MCCLSEYSIIDGLETLLTRSYTISNCRVCVAETWLILFCPDYINFYCSNVSLIFKQFRGYRGFLFYFLMSVFVLLVFLFWFFFTVILFFGFFFIRFLFNLVSFGFFFCCAVHFTQHLWKIFMSVNILRFMHINCIQIKKEIIIHDLLFASEHFIYRRYCTCRVYIHRWTWEFVHCYNGNITDLISKV